MVSKTEPVKKFIGQLCREWVEAVQVTAFNKTIDATAAVACIHNTDVVMDALDNRTARRAVAAWGVQEGIKIITGIGGSYAKSTCRF